MHRNNYSADLRLGRLDENILGMYPNVENVITPVAKVRYGHPDA